MTTYLFYDLKSIQSYIFSIPRLRYVIGGSAVIDRFDRVFARGEFPGCVLVFSGGGKGCFACEDDARADAVQEALRKEAGRFYLDIAFGRSTGFKDAIKEADTLFPAVPEKDRLEGHPCVASGAWPVGSPDETSDYATCRISDGGQRLRYRFADKLLKGLVLPDGLQGEQVAFFENVNPEWLPPSPRGRAVAEQVAFFENVNPESTDTLGSDPEAERAAGRAGAAALGGLNRWAVICMDGNAMGQQAARASELLGEVELVTWARNMSAVLDQVTRTACQGGITQVLLDWASPAAIDDIKKDCRRKDGKIVLPVRPLVVGGDDMTFLCHSAHAFTLVEEIAHAFSELSRNHKDLWLATGGELSVSAGILFCGTSMPLASAVTYAEDLLSQAKRHGRDYLTDEQILAPACLDWEVVTESVIDTPHARRGRMLHFVDDDIQEEVLLTCKPYRLEPEFSALKQRAESDAYKHLPRGIAHRLRAMMNQPYWDRSMGVASLAKQQKALAKDLEEALSSDKLSGRWRKFTKGRQTDVLDIVEIREESRRRAPGTNGEED